MTKESSFTASHGKEFDEEYLNALAQRRRQLPYETESQEEAAALLNTFIEKTLAAVKANDIDGVERWAVNATRQWIVLRHSMSRPQKAALVNLLYELCLTPGLKRKYIRSFTGHIRHLSVLEGDGRRFLDLVDLKLDWRPLWDMLRADLQGDVKEIGVLLDLAKACKHFYSPEEIPTILDEILPILNPDSATVVTIILCAFLPPGYPRLYLPVLFQIAEAFNNGMVWLYILDRLAELVELQITFEHDKSVWRDVGIFTASEWALIVNRSLSFLSSGIPLEVLIRNDRHVGLIASLKHPQNHGDAIAAVLVYSMSVDGPVRPWGDAPKGSSPGFLAGSRALETLHQFITSKELLFHPSSSTSASFPLTLLTEALSRRFIWRWKEEEGFGATTSIDRRLTAEIRRAFVHTLCTPTLMAIFSKESESTGRARSTLRNIAFLEPDVVMPEFLERAYAGLETVNETHRTTAVLMALADVAIPLASENVWFGGQKHVLPLLNLALPGIDLNDPNKTMATTRFISCLLMTIPISSLVGATASTDAARYNDSMEVDPERQDEIDLVIDSSAEFEDWVVMFFNRCLQLFEGLPEEGGRNKKTGGKAEENMLASIREAVDIVCFQLSDPLFDVVLLRIFEYASGNTKLNTMRAFTHLVRRLTRTNPEKALAKFLPHCITKIKVELDHGAASVATTTTHQAVHSDTALLWNLSILHAALTNSGPSLVKYQDSIVELLNGLIDRVKNERAYNLVGGIIRVVFESLTATYTLTRHSLNTDLWSKLAGNRRLQQEWGRFYDAEDVALDWHVPSNPEVDMVLRLLEQVTSPTLDVLEKLLKVSPNKRDKAWRNEWCRRLAFVTSTWKGLDTIIVLQDPDSQRNAWNEEFELPEMHEFPFQPRSNMVLTDTKDKRYQAVSGHRKRFGNLLHQASTILQSTAGEDLVDAEDAVITAIDTYIVHYGIKTETTRRKRAALDASKKGWVFTRRQYHLPRLLWIKFAEGDHSYRLQYFSQTRRFSEHDISLLKDVLEWCRSPYLRIRRRAQSLALLFSSGSAKLNDVILKDVLDGLQTDSDHDRVKGGLFTLRLGELAQTGGQKLPERLFSTLLASQRHEKDSVQHLVAVVFEQAIQHLGQEAPVELPFRSTLAQSIQRLETIYSVSDSVLEKKMLQLSPKRFELKRTLIRSAFNTILETATRPKTHWRYIDMSLRALNGLKDREFLPPVDYARFLAQCTIHAHASIRSHGRRGLGALFNFTRLRTFSKTRQELWMGNAHSTLHRDVPIRNTEDFIQQSNQEVSTDGVYFDWISGFAYGWAFWKPVPANQAAPAKSFAFTWEEASKPMLQAVLEVMQSPAHMESLIGYYAEEPNTEPSQLDVRTGHVQFIQHLCEEYGPTFFPMMRKLANELWSDENRYKQRAAAEIFIGLVAGSTFWSQESCNDLWQWVMECWPTIFQQIKPDTMFWEALILWSFMDRDPRRSQPLVDWILKLEIDFENDSAFSLKKELSVLSTFYSVSTARYYAPHHAKHLELLFNNIQTEYAEVQTIMAGILDLLLLHEWRPSFSNMKEFLTLCATQDDVFGTRNGKHSARFIHLAEKLPVWRKERRPLPHAHQSTYDTTMGTLIQLFVGAAAAPHFYLHFPYLHPLLKEFVATAEITDNPALSNLSVAITRVLLAIASPSYFVQPLFNTLADAFKESTSWRVRQRSLVLLSGIYLRYVERWTEDDVKRMLDVMLTSLEDENVEVRTSTSSNLAWIVRCSLRGQIAPLQRRFLKQARRSVLPPKSAPDYDKVLRVRHAAVLGLLSLVRAYPFTVPEWMPGLIEQLSRYVTDPSPISTAVRTFGPEFQKTHQDNWNFDSKLFNEDQLLALSTLVSGTSYYA